jgi:hypothetical protein
MRWRVPELVIGFLIGVASFTVLFLLSLDIAAHPEICDTTREGARHCVTYNVVTFALRKIGDVLESYSGLIIALATIAIAYFVLTLRRATDRLWKAGQRQRIFLLQTSAAQSRDMQAAIAVAQQSADAASTSAAATERALAEIARPWLFVDDVKIKRRDRPDVQNAWAASLQFRNIGKGPCLVDEIVFRIAEKDGLPEEPDYRTNADRLICQRTIRVDETATTNDVGPAPHTPNRLVMFGRVTYRELDGRAHHTGFAFEVSPHLAEHWPYANKSYEYYD